LGRSRIGFSVKNSVRLSAALLIKGVARGGEGERGGVGGGGEER
jgi:hypothetical protein